MAEQTKKSHWFDRVRADLAQRLMPPADRELHLVGGFRRTLRRTTTHITKQIEFAVSVSEKEVLAIGSALTNILRQSKKRVETCKKLLGNVDSDSKMAQVIAAQYETMHDHMARMSDGLGEQRSLANQAFEYSAQIVEAGERIASIARTAKLLNVNAQVEAARLGDAGLSVGVVADEMTRLSSEIEKANQLMSRLAGALAECMPTLTHGAEQLSSEATTFATTFEKLQDEVRAAQGEVTEHMRDLLTESQSDAESAWTFAKDALGHLNYQDPMAQGLRKVTLVTDKLRGQYDVAFRNLLAASKRRAEALSEQRSRATPHADAPSASGNGSENKKAIVSRTDGVWNGAVPLASNPLANFARAPTAAKVQVERGPNDRSPPTENDTFGGGPEGTAGSVMLFDEDSSDDGGTAASEGITAANEASPSSGDTHAGDVLLFDDDDTPTEMNPSSVDEPSDSGADIASTPAPASGDVLLFDDDDADAQTSYDKVSETDSDTPIRDAAAGDVILF